MKGKRVTKGSAGAIERDTSGRRRMVRKEGEGAFQVVSALPASEFRDAVTRSKGSGVPKRKRTAAGPASVREVNPGSSFVLLSAPKGKAAGFRRLLGRLVEEANTAGLEAVWRALEKVDPQPAPTAGMATREVWRETEAARWAEIRAEWLKRHPALTAAEVARLAGSNTVNPSALLNGWVEAGRVFGLTQGRQRLYPAFQIGRDGQPKEAFRTLLTALDSRLDGWPLAIWLTKPNAEFDGWATPLDVIERDPEAVAEAARLEVQEASY
jgi:hypothetical protein